MTWGDRAAEQYEKDQPSNYVVHHCPSGHLNDPAPGPQHDYDCDLWDPR